MKKMIELEIDESILPEDVDENGDFKFCVYTSNQCEGDFEDAIETLNLIWNTPLDVSLAVHIKLKDVYNDTFDLHTCGDKAITAKSAPLFASLRKDCQWIIDQIDTLEKL
jgi:hypothetical protein